MADLKELIAHAEALVASVQRDDTGQLVGQIWMGGNGGLLSRETLAAADKLRTTIAEIKRAQE